MIQFSTRFSSHATIFTCFILLLCASHKSHAQTPSPTPSPTPAITNSVAAPPVVARAAAPYEVGERLTYNVSFSNFPSAAHLQISVGNREVFFERDAIELQAHVETIGVVNAALYAINNDYRTYINPNTGLPFRTIEDRRTGAQAGSAARDYNQPLGTEAIPARSRAIVVGGTYDFLSALYRVRALPLDIGTAYRLRLDSNASQVSGQYDLEVRVTGRESIKTNIGSFNTLVADVRVPNTMFAKSGIRINFSDDVRHVPVRFLVNLSQGEIKAELASSELPSAVAPPTINTPAVIASNTTTNPPVVAPTAPLVTGELPFKVGEQLNYNVFLGANAQPAGTVSCQVRPRADYFGRNGLMLSASAQTLAPIASGDNVFADYDGINSYVDAETLLPFRTEIRTDSEAANANTRIVTLDQTRGVALVGDGVRREMPIGTHDLVSVAYALRLFRLTPQNRTRVSVLVGNRPLTLVVATLARETISISNQRIPAVQLSLTTNDAQADKYQMRLWVSEDARRLPLRFTTNTPMGVVRADLAIIPVVTQ